MLSERVHCNYLINIGKMIMKKRNQITQAAVLAVATMTSVGAMAEIASVTASVTVDNSIDFTSAGTLNFGTLRAVADNSANNCAYVTLSAGPAAPAIAATGGAATTAFCTGAGNAAVQSIGGTLERPTFTIAGVAAFTTLDVTLPTTVELTAPLAPGAASFFMRDFTAWKTSGTPGAVTTTIQVDGTGGAVFQLGATLHTDDSFAGQNYENNIAYTGNIDVEVAYQ